MNALHIFLTVGALFMVILFSPIGRKRSPQRQVPHVRFDERDTMFSRRELEPGTERFREYYGRHPEKKILDDAFRLKPGLLSKQAAHYTPLAFAAAEASFAAIGRLHANVEGESASERVPTDPGWNAKFAKTWARKLGAASVGVAELQNYHLYSTAGRGDRYGRKIEKEHPWAVAFTVEMDRQMMDCAPQATVIMESARQYLISGAMAVQLAGLIRNLGYSARAHIDANYLLICPLVARDAGLGEIGRMGLLMTPRLGPRVRIAVVTTDFPLVPDPSKPDDSVLDFCSSCRKCADNCPAGAIPFEDREEVDGVLRWRINSEACFTYWCSIGTDCGICMRVCPFSHPDNLLHNAVRHGVRYSPVFRRMAVRLDDVVYGRRPTPKKMPNWLK
jgi:ferredoxin